MIWFFSRIGVKLRKQNVQKLWQLSFTNLWNRLRRHCLDFRLSLQLMIKLCIFEMLSNYRCDLTSGFIQTSPGCLGNWCSRSARFSPEVSLYAFQVHRGFVLLIFMLLLSLNTINIVVTCSHSIYIGF